MVILRRTWLISCGFITVAILLLLEPDFLDSDHNHVQRHNSVIEGEDLATDGELLLLHEGRRKLLHLLLEQSNDLLKVDEVDRQREDRRLEGARDEHFEVLVQLFFALVALSN